MKKFVVVEGGKMSAGALEGRLNQLAKQRYEYAFFLRFEGMVVFEYREPRPALIPRLPRKTVLSYAQRILEWYSSIQHRKHKGIPSKFIMYWLEEHKIPELRPEDYSLLSTFLEMKGGEIENV